MCVYHPGNICNSYRTYVDMSLEEHLKNIEEVTVLSCHI